MRNTKWLFQDKILNHLEENYYDKEIVEILHNRGILTSKEIDVFFHSKVSDLMNPNDFKDVDKAIKKIIEAKKKNKSIWIYGDYDVDGITSTALCYLALKEIGLNVNYYIPLRDEGYGLNEEALTYIKDNGGEIVITVDCGISSIKEVEHANNIGLEVIITDHHDINDVLPPAYAVINPKREDNKYNYKILAGVGTAFIFLKGLYKKLKIEQEIYKYLDIVAIGTVADIVQLKGENRIIVKEGLELLKSSRWLGLNMLLKRIFENPKEREFDTYDVGFIIAPIFNAAGRLEDAKMGVELLISDDHVRCTNLITELVQKNSERKELQEKIFEKVIEEIENNELDKNPILIVAKKGFHHGVIGIVASKILDRYYKPTIIMEIKENEGIATASCRSIEGFNIVEALNYHKDFFIKYGGHSGAAGFSIPIDKIDEFSKQINEYASKKITDEDKKRPVKIDSEISILKIGFDLMDKLAKLEPYGFGNPTPIFLLRNCRYENLRLIGKEQNHIMFDLKKNGETIKNCVWFNSDDVFTRLVETKEIDIAFKLKREIFKDKYYYKIFIEDIKISNEFNEFDEIKRLYEIKFPIKSVFYTRRDLRDKNISLKLNENDISIVMGKNEVGFLESATKNLLLKLNKYYNYNYSIKIENIIQKDENFNVCVEIDLDREFKTLALSEGVLFQDIKRHLIGNSNYNSIQKKVLSAVFKDKKKVYTEIEEGRGVGTILETIRIFFEVKGERIEIVKKGSFILVHRFEDEIPFLVISSDKKKRKKYEKEGYSIILDDYQIPENVILVQENELKNYKNIFNLKLPNFEKEQMILKAKKGEKIYSTQDIKIIF